MSEWIKTGTGLDTGRLPETTHMRVLVNTGAGVEIGRCEFGPTWIVEGVEAEVTHWMPLPEPPK